MEVFAMSDICPKCGEIMFSAIPGQTTEDEIIEFGRKATFQGAETIVREKGIHPGEHCSKCGTIATVEYVIPGIGDPPGPFTLFLEQCGPNRHNVILQTKKLLGLSLAQARKLIDSPRPVLAVGNLWSVRELKKEYEKVGAVVRIDNEPAIPNLEEQLREAINNYYRVGRPK
jgi:ribosomal protein L7/L12